MNFNTLSKAEMIKMLESQQALSDSGLMVKRNSGGGIYIRSTKFQEYSVAKDKFYTAGINVPFNTAKVLFNDPALIELIKEEVNNIPKD